MNDDALQASPDPVSAATPFLLTFLRGVSMEPKTQNILEGPLLKIHN